VWFEEGGEKSGIAIILDSHIWRKREEKGRNFTIQSDRCGGGERKGESKSKGNGSRKKKGEGGGRSSRKL